MNRYMTLAGIVVLLLVVSTTGCSALDAVGAQPGGRQASAAAAPSGPQGPEGQAGPKGPVGPEGKAGPAGSQGPMGIANPTQVAQIAATQVATMTAPFVEYGQQQLTDLQSRVSRLETPSVLVGTTATVKPTTIQVATTATVNPVTAKAAGSPMVPGLTPILARGAAASDGGITCGTGKGDIPCTPTPSPIPTSTPKPTAIPTPAAGTATPTQLENLVRQLIDILSATPQLTATAVPTSTPAPTATPAPMGFTPQQGPQQSCAPEENSSGGCTWDVGAMDNLTLPGGFQASQVGIVKGVRIQWNGLTVGSATDPNNRCALVILNRNSWFRDLNVMDANVALYDVDARDVPGWTKTLAVQAAFEQTADYGCPAKRFEDIPLWDSPNPSPPFNTPGFITPAKGGGKTVVSTTSSSQQATAQSGQDCSTVDCKERKQTADFGGKLAFQPGDAVGGFKVTVNGVGTFTNCRFDSAPGDGAVVDGVVHLWKTEAAVLRLCN